jgi:hypothetical protein
VLLGGAVAVLATAIPARADYLAPAFTSSSTRPLTASFHAAGEAALDRNASQNTPADPLLPLALILAIPAGTGANTGSSQAANTVVKSPGGSQGASDPGVHTASVQGSNKSSTGSNSTSSTILSPEPASFLTAAIGSGLAGLAVLRRRRMQHHTR